MIEKAAIKKLMGLNLVRLRTGANLTATDLADQIGCALSTISKAEHGQQFGTELLTALCNFFSVDPFQFFMPAAFGTDGMDSYSLTVEDNSMAPMYQPGDTVFVDPGHDVKNGDCVVATIKSQVVIRRFYGFGKQIVLTAINTEVSPILVTEKDTSSIHKIVGMKTRQS